MDYLKIVKFGELKNIQIDVNNFTTLSGLGPAKDKIGQILCFVTNVVDHTYRDAMNYKPAQNLSLDDINNLGLTHVLKNSSLLNFDPQYMGMEIEYGFGENNRLNIKYCVQSSEIYVSYNKLFGENSVINSLLHIPSNRSLIFDLFRINSRNFDKYIMDRLPIVDKIYASQISMLKNKFIDEPQLLEKKDNSEYTEIINYLGGSIHIDKEVCGIYLKIWNKFNKKYEYKQMDYSSNMLKEIFWPTLLMYLPMVKKYANRLIFEYPETHLNPSEQIKLIEFIALYQNITNSQVIIITDSVYVIATINSYIFAHDVGQIKTEDVNKILPKKYWIDYDKISAYLIEKNICYNIKCGCGDDIDSSIKMIKNEKLDEDAQHTLLNYDIWDSDVSDQKIDVEKLDDASLKLNGNIDNLFDIDDRY